MPHMRARVKRANTWLRTHPMRGLLALAAGAALAFGCYRWGRVLLAPSEGLPEGERSLFGRFLAWPGGTYIAFGLGTIVLGLLLVPDGRLDGRWRWLAARAVWWATIVFATLQMFDDHLLDQAGTSNPLGVEIPYPFQDLLEIPCLLLLGVVFLGGLVTLPARLLRRKAPT